MFNGSIPIVLDSLKQHYFIDRDGKMFRHILNFLRTSSLSIPDNFDEVNLLYEEARFYDIHPLMRLLQQYRLERISNTNNNANIGVNGSSSGLPSSNGVASSSSSMSLRNTLMALKNRNNLSSGAKRICSRRNNVSDEDDEDQGNKTGTSFDCLALHISPDLGERLMLSGERSLIEEVFPEISATLMDARSGVAWNSDAKHVIRFPLNGYCKLLSLQAISRMLSHGFKIYASNGGGVEGQQFSEYLFVRQQQHHHQTQKQSRLRYPSMADEEADDDDDDLQQSP